MPPEPRLQVTAPRDLKTYRDDQEKILQGYSWVDSQAGLVRIPIDRAMNLMLQKGYPVRGAASKANPQVAPGTASAEGKH